MVGNANRQYQPLNPNTLKNKTIIDQKIAHKVSVHLKDLADGIDEALIHIAGERIGFSLLVYTPGRASYIGNCSREESIEQLETLLKLWKEGMPDIKAHEVN